MAYSLADGSQVNRWALGSDLGAIDVSANGRYVFVTERQAGPDSGTQWERKTDYYIYMLDTFTGAKTTYTFHATGYDGAFVDLAVLADGTALLTQNFLGSGWEPLTRLNPVTGTFTSSGSYSQDGTLNVTPDDRFVAFTPHNISDAPVYYYISGIGVTASRGGYADGVSGFNGGVQAISPDGTLVAEGVAFNVYDANLHVTASLQTLYPELGSPLGLAFSADGATLFALESKDIGILAFSTADWSLTGQFAYHVNANVNGFGDTMVVSPDGKTISVLGDNGLEAINLASAMSPAADQTISYAGAGPVYTFGGNDTVTLTGGASFVRTGSGNDRVVIAPSLFGSAGTTTVDAGSGDDTLDLSQLIGITVGNSGGGGTDTSGSRRLVSRNFEHLQLSSGDDTASFSTDDASHLEVLAGDGNDMLQGGPSMALRGQGGNDVFQVVAGGGDVTHGVIDGGAGIDRVRFGAGFTIDMGAGIAVNGNASYSLIGIENVMATAAGTASHVIGDANANAFDVASFPDDGQTGIWFDGAGGNDTLTGSTGNDTLDGGVGSDIATYSFARGSAIVTHDAINHVLYISEAGAGTDTITRIEQFQFSDGLHSFQFGPAQWVFPGFGTAQGWGNEAANPRFLADINGDGRTDIVGFGAGTVEVALGNGGGSFQSTRLGVANFGPIEGWDSQDHFPRMLADVNGDGRADVIGFGQSGVFEALALSDGSFADTRFVFADFGAATGWNSQGVYQRTLLDVNGDGKLDIVGLGQAAVFTALGNGDGTFQTSHVALADMGPSLGWSSQGQFPRQFADVNGDGQLDIVGFGQAAVFVALGSGDGTFHASKIALADMGPTFGWTSQDAFPRMLADVNGDGRADIVAFGYGGASVALAKADGTFAAAAIAVADFGAKQGWASQDKNPRTLADFNHDGHIDIIGFGPDGTSIAFGNGDGTFTAASQDIAGFGNAQGWNSNSSFLHQLADINGDGLTDIVGFADAGVRLALNQGDYLL